MNNDFSLCRIRNELGAMRGESVNEAVRRIVRQRDHLATLLRAAISHYASGKTIPSNLIAESLTQLKEIHK